MGATLAVYGAAVATACSGAATGATYESTRADLQALRVDMHDMQVRVMALVLKAPIDRRALALVRAIADGALSTYAGSGQRR